jgi:hypothetical protein
MDNSFFERYFPGNYALSESDFVMSFRENSLLSVQKLTLYGKDYLLLVLKEAAPFSDLFQVYRRIARDSPFSPVFFFSSQDGHTKRLLMQEGIPFFSKEGFVFLPGVLLLGRLPSGNREQKLRFSPSFIPIIDFFLLHPESSVNSLILQKELACLSRSFIIKGLAFLCQEDFLYKTGRAQSIAYSLNKPLNFSYTIAKQWRINPIRQSFFAKTEDAHFLPRSVLSSESALGFYSDVVPEEESYLLSEKERNEHMSLLCFPEERKNLGDYFRYDVFVYPPYLLKDDQEHLILNPLDVIAIYQSDDDPRVQLAIKKMEERFA